MNLKQQKILICAIEYWFKKWDFESPLLFGVSKDEVKSIADEWPTILETNRRLALRVSAEAMREILYGASAVKENKLKELLDTSFEEATALLNNIRLYIE